MKLLFFLLVVFLLSQSLHAQDWFVQFDLGPSFPLNYPTVNGSGIDGSIGFGKNLSDGLVTFLDFEANNYNTYATISNQAYFSLGANIEKDNLWTWGWLNPYVYGGVGLVFQPMPYGEGLGCSLTTQAGLGSQWNVTDKTKFFLEAATHFPLEGSLPTYVTTEAGLRFALVPAPSPEATPVPTVAPPTLPTPTPAPLEKFRRVFDVNISFPFNFVPAQTETYPSGSGSSVLNNTGFGLQVFLDYYLFDDLTVGLYFDGLAVNNASTYSYNEVELESAGVGVRVKKEFVIDGPLSLEPYVGLGYYAIDNFLDSIEDGRALGGIVGLDAVWYLDKEKDASLEVGAGYRVLPLSAVQLTNVVPYYYQVNPNPPTFQSLSGFYVNFLQLKETFSVGSPETAAWGNAKDVTPFIKVAGGFNTANAGYYGGIWGENPMGSLEGGVDFPDGLSFFLDGDYLSSPPSEHWALTGNIEYIPTFFHVVRPYVFIGLGAGLWDGPGSNPSVPNQLAVDFQLGFGTEYDLTRGVALFGEAKALTESHQSVYYAGQVNLVEVATGLKFKL